MRFRSHLQLLKHLAKDHDVIVTIMVQTHRSKRMYFKLPFDQLGNHFDGYLIHNYGKDLIFKSTKGKRHRFEAHSLRNVSFVSVDINEKEENKNGIERSLQIGD